jgi:hypothetical protein
MLRTWPTGISGDRDLVDYFRRGWVEGDLKNWYEGASRFISTNNGLEAINKNIKDSHMLRNKLPLNKFFRTAEEMVGYFNSCEVIY